MLPYIEAPRVITRKQFRLLKREAKARAYRTASLKGGGAREVARRLDHVCFNESGGSRCDRCFGPMAG